MKLSKIWPLFFIGLTLRLLSVSESLWHDEAIAAQTVIQLSPTEYFSNFLRSDFHPPLYYFIQKLLYLIFGQSEIIFRLPALLSGLAIIYVSYLIILKINSHQNKLLLFSIITTSPLLVYYSLEARPYSLTVLVVLINYLCLIKLRKKITSAVSIWYFLTGVIIIYLNYLAYFYLFISFSILIIGLVKQRKIFSKFILFPIFGFVLSSAPIILIITSQLKVGNNIARLTPGWEKIIGSQNPVYNFAQFILKIVTGRVDFDINPVTLFFATTISISIFGYLAYLIYKKKNSLHLFVFCSVSVLVFLTGIFYPIYSYFRLLYLVPFVYFSIISGPKAKLQTYLLWIILAGNVLFTGFYYLNPVFWRENWKDAGIYTNWLISRNPDYIVVFPTAKPYESFSYYNQSLAASGVSDTFSITEHSPQKLQNILQHDSIIYYDYLQNLTDPDEKTLNFIRKYYTEQTGYSFNKVGSVKLFIQK